MTPVTIEDLEAELALAVQAGIAEDMARIGREIDAWEAEHPHTKPTLLGSALWYAEQGLHIFALTPGTKIPHKDSNGCKDATTDADRIRGWWEQWPGSNVGIATGHLVDVIDIDGKAGQESYAAHLDEMTNLKVLGVVSTPRPGGMHLYIPATGAGNRAGVLPSIDYRGLGGYVVAPPSTNEIGSYRFIAGGLNLGGTKDAA